MAAPEKKQEFQFNTGLTPVDTEKIASVFYCASNPSLFDQHRSALENNIRPCFRAFFSVEWHVESTEEPKMFFTTELSSLFFLHQFQKVHLTENHMLK
jgi:hypothetical protein